MKKKNTEEYICKYGLYHDKPCKDKQPSSNNGWIYTAYAEALSFKTEGPGYYCALIEDCRKKKTLSEYFNVKRLPGKINPPVSRDELIGMITISKKRYLKDILNYNWTWCDMRFLYFGIFDQLKAVWSLRNEHRNYVWESHIFKAYPIVFRLYWHDRFYIKSILGKKTSIFEHFWFILYVFSTILQKDVSAKNILWLQLKNLNSKIFIRFINQKQNFLTYFGPNHPFNS